jgi:hypothetical protein
LYDQTPAATVSHHQKSGLPRQSAVQWLMVWHTCISAKRRWSRDPLVLESAALMPAGSSSDDTPQSCGRCAECTLTVCCCDLLLGLTWQVIVTRWGSDPFALGSYAMMPPGSGPDDMAALAAPVGDVLFFAGEAMSLSNQGTVHGAYATGRDAAAAVIAVHRQQQRHSVQQKEQQAQKEQQPKSC